MKKKFMKQTAVTLVVTILAGLSLNNVTVDAFATKNISGVSIQNVSEEEITTQEIETEEPTTIGIPTGEILTSEGETTEEPTSEEPTSEEPTSEEPTSEEPTSEEPTTEPEFIIIDEVYKVKDGVLIEYLGNKEDETVTELTIPKEIKIIGNSIFSNYKYITTVEFEEGSELTEIGEAAFKDCDALSKITLPEGLTKIGYRAFGKCMSLKSLKIPTTVTEGDRIFGTTNAVTSVTFKKGTKSIPATILKYAYSVETVKMYSGVTTIGKQSFYKCKALTSITIPGTVTKIGSSAFNGCENMATVSLSKNVTSIGSYAFKNCKILQKLTLRKAVTSIGKDAFLGDANLTLYVYANSYAKRYARENGIKWEYTSSEIKRQAASQEVYKKYLSLIKAKDVNKFKLKKLKNYVPQGLCIVGKYVIVSMYYKGLKKNSILLLYNKNTGEYVKKVVLPSKDHVGSITNVKGRLVVGLCNISTTDYVAVISASKLKKIKNGKTIKYDYKTKIPGYADFATFDGTIFWAGHSANISYAKMYGYKVTVKKKKLVFTKKYSYTVPANSQGLIVKKGKGSNRTFIFSQSYGRLGDSSLITYKAKIKTAKSLGTAKSTKLMPSMSEGICLTSKGYVYMVFESGAGIYCGDPDLTTEIQVNNICRMKYSNLEKLQEK